MDAVRAAVVAAGLPLILKDWNNAPDFPPPRLRDTPDPEALRPASAPMMWFYQMTTTVWDGLKVWTKKADYFSYRPRVDPGRFATWRRGVLLEWRRSTLVGCGVQTTRFSATAQGRVGATCDKNKRSHWTS